MLTGDLEGGGLWAGDRNIQGKTGAASGLTVLPVQKQLLGGCKGRKASKEVGI